MRSARTRGAPGEAHGAPREARRVPERALWADVATGVCILLVVLWHVVVKHYLRIDWGVPPPIPGAWGALTEQLLPLRMPLFFTISGMFAAGAVTRPWRVVRRSKVGRCLYLYAVWLLIHTAVLALVPSFDTARADDVAGLPAQLTITPSNLWYLYALALYYVIHMPLLALLHLALVPPLSAGMDGMDGTDGTDGRSRIALAVVEPVALTALVVWLCLAFHRLLLMPSATWLFDLPGRGPRNR